MAKKQKKEAASKEAPQVEVKEKEKEIKKEKKTHHAHQAAPKKFQFSDEFHEKIANFSEVSGEILALRAESAGTNPSEEINAVNEKVNESIELEGSKIFKRELEDLQKWVEGEQLKIKGDIEKLNNTYEENRKTLLSTGAFSEEEVKSQISPIRQKVDQRQEVYDKYETLLQKSKKLYS